MPVIATGGARVGWIQISWPFVRLSASATGLAVAGRLVGTHSFKPSDVLALEPYGLIPVVGRGVRIVHARTDCPSTIVFRSIDSPGRLIAKIRAAGFVPSAPPAVAPGPSGAPVRWSVLVVAIIVWNALLLADGFVVWRAPKAPGPLTFLALVLLLLGASSIKVSSAARRWVLKPGRSVEEIAGILSLLQLLAGLMLAVLGVLAVAAGR